MKIPSDTAWAPKGHTAMTASATPYTDILTALEASSLTDQPPHAAWVRAKQSEDAFLALAKDMEAYSETYAPPVRLAFKLVFENDNVSIQSHHFETEQKSAHERLTDAANAPAFTSMHAFVEALSLHPIYGKVFVGEKPERITVSYNGETFMVYLEIPSHNPDERATLLVINDSLFSPPEAIGKHLGEFTIFHIPTLFKALSKHEQNTAGA